MRPYWDAFKFFMKYLALLGITGLSMITAARIMICMMHAHILVLIAIFGPIITGYFLLVKLLKRYEAFYCEIREIRSDMKERQFPYSRA